MDKRKITLTVIGVAVLLVVLVGSTYAYWTIGTNTGESRQATVQTGGLILRLDDVNGITSNDVIDPNHLSFSKYFSITNESNADGYAKILFKGLTNTFVSDALVYDLEEVQSDKSSFTEPRMIITNQVLPKSATASNQTLADGLLVEKGTIGQNNTVTPNTKYYKLTVRYKYSDTVNQNADLNQTLVSGFTMEEGQMSVSMTVSFDTNDENITTPSNITVTMGQTYNNLPNVTKDGLYMNWYTDSEYSEIVKNNSIVTKNSNHVLYGKAERILPQEYSQLTYLESNGNQYIDIDVLGNVGYHYIINAEVYSQGGDMIAAYTNGNNTNGLHIFESASQYTSLLNNGGQLMLDNKISFNEKHNFDFDTSEGTITIDGITQSTHAHATKNGFPTLNLYLFACNDNNNANYYFYGKIYGAVSIYSANSSNLLYELYPAKRETDGFLGMYDVVRNRFFTNLGTGVDFTPGEELW